MHTHLVSFRFVLVLLISHANLVMSQTILPRPDHIVIVIMENHSFNQIIGSSAAPYINSLANDTLSALFTQSYGVTHPSQPNYLALYSGNTQGITDDLVPSNNPFTTPNIGKQLINSGKTFTTYSEDLPGVGYNGETSGYYARKHSPASNWIGTGTNQIPPTTNQSFAAFPSSNFKSLPTVCFIMPNLLNDMHDGADPAKITRGDQWISNNMNSYVQWAKANNSLFILTFDEDNTLSSNHIATIFTGRMIQSGQYTTRINHYTIFHTLEKLYGLPTIGDSIAYPPINFCWKKNYLPNSLLNLPDNTLDGLIYPNPCNGFFYIELSDYQHATAELYHLNGEFIQVCPLVSKETEIKTDGLNKGLYLVKIRNKEGIIQRKIIIN
ncbi:MAG: alkaline phosphatase family protein [Bacteroidota bacterium]|nr:alkaline phosphatase family protein [Bacteroidota bacterium]